MKLVGASNWFVRGPFMVEGMPDGLLGAAAAVDPALPRARSSPCRRDRPRLDAGKGVHAIAFEYTALTRARCSGSSLGAAGSPITMRRFLRV